MQVDKIVEHAIGGAGVDTDGADQPRVHTLRSRQLEKALAIEDGKILPRP
jgi:hypothetical protein